MNRGDLTDRQWARIQPLLPPQRPPKGSKGGRPRNDDRTMINGILWILRTGAPWPDLPARYGPPSSVSTRLYRWQDSGVWGQILAAVQAEADAEGDLDWETHQVDATVIRPHQHAAGAKRYGIVCQGPISREFFMSRDISKAQPSLGRDEAALPLSHRRLRHQGSPLRSDGFAALRGLDPATRRCITQRRGFGPFSFARSLLRLTPSASLLP